MSIKSLLSRSFIGAATLLSACGWDIGHPVNEIDSSIQSIVETTSAPERISILCNPDTTQAIVWGDSIANGIGQVLHETLEAEMAENCETIHDIKTINFGVDSSGYHAAEKAVPTQTLLAAVKPGSIIFINVGTNDVDYVMNFPHRLNNYVSEITSLAQQIRERGGNPVIIGMQAPFHDYGLIRGDYRTRWTEKMHVINLALETESKNNGTAFISNHIAERRDGLHYTKEGSAKIISQALASLAQFPSIN